MEMTAKVRMRADRPSARAQRGQMSVELMAVLPVALIIAAIVVNALVFLGDCASFDRLARNAIRTYACSPTYGVQAPQVQSSIREQLEGQVNDGCEQVEVSFEGVGGGLTRYVATLDYAPNLFGLGLRDSVLGVPLPHLRHSTSLVVDAYRPGVVFS
jgi:hypothetical protein